MRHEEIIGTERSEPFSSTDFWFSFASSSFYFVENEKKRFFAFFLVRFRDTGIIS